MKTNNNAIALLKELQNKLLVANRKSSYLNALPNNSKTKIDLFDLKNAYEQLPFELIDNLLKSMPFEINISLGNSKISKTLSAKLNNLLEKIDNLSFETGQNHLGLGFPLLIRRDEKDENITVSPLFIFDFTLTKIDAKTFILKREETSFQLNPVLINHIKIDSDLVLPTFSGEKLTKQKLIQFSADVLQKLNNGKQNLIPTDFKLAEIPKKESCEKALTESSHSFVSYSGVFSVFKNSNQNIIKAYDNLLKNPSNIEAFIDNNNCNDFQEDNKELESLVCIETDPSQQHILLKNDSKVIIQGPPGTGKSQTLTALLLKSLLNNKKALVVCEKHTALEVLAQNLKNIGLEEEYVIVKNATKDRANVVSQAKNRVRDLDSFCEKSHQSYFTDLNRLKADIEKINSVAENLNKPILGDMTFSSIVSKLLIKTDEINGECFLNIDYNSFPKPSAEELDGFCSMLEEAQQIYLQFNEFSDLFFINAHKFSQSTTTPYLLEDEFKTDFEVYSLDLRKFKHLSKNFEVQYKKTKKEHFKTIEKDLIGLAKSIDRLNTLCPKAIALCDKTNSLLTKAQVFFLPAKKQELIKAEKLRELFYDFFDNILQINPKIEVPTSFAEKLSFCLNDLDQFLKDFNSTVDENIKNDFDGINFFDKSVSYQSFSPLYNELQETLDGLTTKLEKDDWFSIDKNHHSSFVQCLELMLDRQKRYLNTSQKADLFSVEYRWHNFILSQSDLKQLIVNQLLDKTNTCWKTQFEVFYLDMILKEQVNIEGFKFNRDKLLSVQNQLNRLCKTQIPFIKDLSKNKLKDAVKNFREKNPNKLTVTNLFRQRNTKKGEKLPLKKIASVDFELFTSIFPIVFTTPDTACNLFEQEQQFDYVIFDEASQLKLEDTLPLLLKGKNVIISGDENQMPPLDFFAKNLDNSIDDIQEDLVENEVYVNKEDLLFQSESLLDFCSQLDFQKTYLNYHYRSQPSLINFSNNSFYGGRLITVKNDDYSPIEFHQIDGQYKNFQNIAEAEKVISIIQDIKPNEKGIYPSVGIGTFNVVQRDLIKNLLEDKQIHDGVFRDKMNSLQEKGFFLKNLVNIQGEEREIMIISTTFGIKESAVFEEKFGPINQRFGYRLLNVLFSRAKTKMIILTSIPVQKYSSFKSHFEVKTMKGSAFLYAFLSYAKSVSDNDLTQANEILKILLNNNASSNEVNQQAQEQCLFAEYLFDMGINGLKNLSPSKIGGLPVEMLYEKEGEKTVIDIDISTNRQSKGLSYLLAITKTKILRANGYKLIRLFSFDFWRNKERAIGSLKELLK